MCLADVPPEVGGPVRALLQKTSLKEYLHRRPPSHVVTLDVNTTVGEALNQLATYNILSAPLFDKSTGAYLGFLDRKDLLSYVLQNVDVRKISQEELAYRLRTAGARMAKLKLSNVQVGDDGEMIHRANVRHTLLEVMRYCMAGGKGRETHRMAVFDLEEEGAAGDGGGGQPLEECEGGGGGEAEGQDQNWAEDEDLELGDASPRLRLHVTSIVSQSDIIRFLHKHKDQCGLVMAMPVHALGLAAKQVVCVPCDMPAINAFATMDACEVSSVGIVDQRNGGCLVANLSASDLRGLEPHHFGALSLPVFQFMQLRRTREGWPSKAAAGKAGWGLKDEWGLKGAERRGVRKQLVAVRPLEPLFAAVDAIVTNKVHRVYVVDDDSHPLSIITISDIFNLFRP
ncbi:unnamed protein product [Ostreobium quekettii]|uniref:CBS domain-containing protein n=1 Tax=Ostreobium quekettii TaxID=121088 RepID=A0A8S1JCX1_9CHLO|nr:unnamed protein product [Ostreobium quekettii]